MGLRFKWVGQWMTGGDTTRTEEMMVEVDEKQQEVIDQGLALGKFLGTLLVDAAAILPKVEDGLLTGDVVICNRVPTAGRRRRGRIPWSWRRKARPWRPTISPSKAGRCPGFGSRDYLPVRGLIV